MTLRRALPLAALAVLLVPPGAEAQRVFDCNVLPGTENISSQSRGGSPVTYISRPRLLCPDGRYIEADSAVSFEGARYTDLIGRVYFQDATQSLRADRARYYENLSRLEAEGSITLTDRQTGNVLTGETLTYQRVMPGRPDEMLDMQGGRPTATLYAETDTTAPVPDVVPDPYEVVADRISIVGPQFLAVGDVEVERDSLTATSQRMEYDREAGRIEFEGGSRVIQGPMDLTGQSIRMLMPAQQLQEILATEDGHLVTEDLDLTAHTIQMFMTDGVLDRLVAISQDRVTRATRAATGAQPPPEGGAADSVETRAVARAEQLVMRADSIEVVAPAEVLERVVAVGSARAVSSARDSLNAPDTPALIRNDWIEGDTVVAHLRRDSTSTSADSAGYTLDRLEAMGQARTLYRMDPEPERVQDETGAPQELEAPPTEPSAAPDDPPDEPPAPAFTARLPLSYVEAERIRIDFLRGVVDLMVITGLRQGYYLQPEGSARRADGGRP